MFWVTFGRGGLREYDPKPIFEKKCRGKPVLQVRSTFDLLNPNVRVFAVFNVACQIGARKSDAWSIY